MVGAMPPGNRLPCWWVHQPAIPWGGGDAAAASPAKGAFGGGGPKVWRGLTQKGSTGGGGFRRPPTPLCPPCCAGRHGPPILYCPSHIRTGGSGATHGSQFRRERRRVWSPLAATQSSTRQQTPGNGAVTGPGRASGTRRTSPHPAEEVRNRHATRPIPDACARGQGGCGRVSVYPAGDGLGPWRSPPLRCMHARLASFGAKTKASNFGEGWPGGREGKHVRGGAPVRGRSHRSRRPARGRWPQGPSPPAPGNVLRRSRQRGGAVVGKRGARGDKLSSQHAGGTTRSEDKHSRPGAMKMRKEGHEASQGLEATPGPCAGALPRSPAS